MKGHAQAFPLSYVALCNETFDNNPTLLVKVEA